MLVFALFGAFPVAAQSIDTSPVTSATYGDHYIYSISTSGFGSTPTIILDTDAGWLSLTDNFDGTATLEGDANVAGTFNVEITAKDGVDTQTQPFQIIVGKAPLTITADNNDRFYGDANPILSVSYSGFKFTDGPGNLDSAPTTNSGTDTFTGIGHYTITLSVGVDDNYDITPINGDLEIKRATVTATAQPKTRAYGAANPIMTIAYAGFKNSETSAVLTTPVTIGTLAGNSTPVGAIDITVTGGVAANYTINHVNGTLTITKATVTAKATDLSKPYGSANPTLTVDYTGLLNGELAGVIDTPPTPSTAATGATPAGAYGITLSAGTDNNYIVVSQDGTLTINKVNLAAAAHSVSRPYRSANPTLTIDYTGFVLGETASVIATPPTIITTATLTSNAGDYPITISGGTDNNYNFTTYTAGVLTVTKVALAAKADDKNRAYGAANPLFTVSYTGFVGGETSVVIETGPAASTLATTASVPGTYTITLGAGTDENYTFTPTNGVLTIGKATLTATADAKSRNYGSANPVFTITYSGFVNSETIAVINVVPTATTAAITTSVAGNYTIIPAGGSDDMYDFNYVNGNLTVNKVALTATANNQTRPYGGANPVFTVSYTGFVLGETSAVIDTPVTASTTADALSPVGTYAITAAGGLDDNYSFSYVAGTLTIAKATITATADPKSRPYGSANPTFTISYAGFVNGETIAALDALPTATTAATSASNAGTHAITVSGGTDDNYTYSYVSGLLTITKVTITATADAKSKVYGTANPAFTVSYTGFLLTDNASVIDVPPTGSTLATPASHVGSYAITLSGGSDNNYDLTLVAGSLSVTQATLTATPNPQTRAYGAANPTLTIGYTGFVGTDNASVINTPPNAITAAVPSSPVGIYAITLSGGLDDDYLFNLAPGTLTVTKAVLTATADDKSRTYGAANPTFTITYSGFALSESVLNIDTPPTATSAATGTTVVGTSPIVPAGGLDDNYSFIYVNGTLTVTKATLVATPDPKSRTYGATNPAFTVSYTGFLNGETAAVVDANPGGATTATVLSDVGSYTITISGGLDNNYTFTYNTGTLTVTKATLNAIANNQSRNYGAANPLLSITYTGFQNSETAIVIDTPPTTGTAATVTSNVGTYPISISGGTDNNYTFGYTAGTLTIGKASILATADDKTRAYGAANPVFTVTYTGLLNGDLAAVINTPPAMATGAIATSNTGNYAITISGGTDDNYTFTYAPGTLTIGKAILTATPDNKSRSYGLVNPVFTVTYSGFVNSETAVVVDVPPSFSTAATVTSIVGTYPITASGASDTNYDFTYNPGTLTITKGLLTATANNQTRTYGAANPALTIAYSGFQNGETSAVLDVQPTTGTAAGATTAVGPYPITISGGSDDNYAYSYVAGTLTITKATLTVTADDKLRFYNTANPAFTLTYSGFLNAETAAVIDSAPVGSTSALVTSPVGQYTINASGGTDNNYALTYVSGLLTISKATPNVSWSAPLAITYGTALSATQLNATANVGGSFVYTPAGGTVLNAGPHALSVDFTPSDLTNYNVVNGTIANITVNKATPIITWPTPTAITYGTTLSATQLNASTTIVGTFVYTPAAGTLLGAGAGQILSVNFTPSDAANYNSVNNTQRLITVDKAIPIVSWSNPGAITYGTPLSAVQQNATASVPGTFTYVPGPGTILATGANQAIAVNFAPTDAANYTAVNGTQVLITVNKATPTVSWATPADITYGTALGATQLNATSSVPGSFVYVPASGTLLLAGNGQSLIANFTPTDAANYNSVPGKQVFINVLKATPVITWTAPGAITYGTALSATQLSASANVPGTFMYTPALGTVLNAGVNQVLSVNFTPSDAANYNAASTTRQITVNKALPVITWANPAAITYGTPLSATQQNATSSVPGTLTYTPAPGTILNVGTNQPISVGFVPTDATNYSTVPTTTVQITVNKATPVVTWATPLPIKVFVTLSSVQLNATASVPGTFTYNPAAGTFYILEGTYTLSVAFTPTDAANYNSVPVTQVQIVVSSKDNPVITWGDPSAITYGTLLGATQQNATADVAGTFSYNPAPNALLNAGSNQNLNVTFTPSDGTNYNSISKTVHINVNKATLTATAANASRAYGVNNPTFVLNYTGFMNGETASVIDTQPTASCSAIASDPAGSTFPIIPAGGVDNNYLFTYVSGTLSINKAPLIAKADNKTRTYGNTNPPFTITYSGFVNGDVAASIIEPTASTPATPASNVGSYTITLTGGSSTNYTFALQTGTLSVTPSPLVAKANDLVKIYGQPNPALTIQYLGFVNGDSPASITEPGISTTATTTSGVGNYNISLTGGAASNYGLILFPGTLTINKAPLTAKADNKTRIYGQVNPANSITYTGFVGADGPASITPPVISGPAATAASNVGTYPIQLSGGSGANYDLTLQNGTLTITKANLTAKADNKTRVYGSANPTFTITYTGFLNGDDPSDVTAPDFATTAAITSDVGGYTISLTGGNATNYSFTLQTGTLTITPAGLVAKANDLSRNYGSANPTLTMSYTGFLNGDTFTDITQPTPSTTAVIGSNAGTYPITLAGGSAINYTLTRQAGILTVAKAPLTAKADNTTKVYGTANPANSITYTGFVNGDDASDITAPTITGPSATTASPVGTYPITLSGGTATNYIFTVLQSGALTITQASLTAKADNKARLYGATNPAFTITYTGFVGADTQASITQPVASTVAVATSNVGSYAITLAGTTQNYAFTFVDGTLTINKTSLTATANNLTKVYGAANPTLSITYAGFVNSETASVIDAPPLAVTTATGGSSVGNYPITLSGASDNNYSFSYVSGTLSISKASLTAKADNQTRFFGDPNPTNTITYTGFVNGDDASDILAPTASTAATTTSPFGSYPIVLTGGSATNYVLTLLAGTLTITPAMLTVTAKNLVKAYGSANPVLELTYSGFVNGQTLADIDTPPTPTTTATLASNAGTYVIDVAGGADPNYSFFYVSGTLTVNKAILTATADNKTTTYGTIPPLTITYSGFVNGETIAVIDTPPTASTTATGTSPLGTFTISVNGGVDNNYSFTNVAGNLSIGKAVLTVKADDKSRIIGLPNPVLTITYTGFMNNEDESVLNTPPTATTTATIASIPGTYPIVVSGGTDNFYDFNFQTGVLTVVLDNPPVVKNFQVQTDEDKRLNLTLSLFAANYTDDPNGKIIFIKVTALPQNGVLFKAGGSRVVVGDEIKVTGTELDEFYYTGNSNYSGTDAFGWNLFDGSFLAVTNATVTIKVVPVNDPPVLSNIESTSLKYSPGDAPVKITNELIINDVDDNFIFSASILIANNFSEGDELSVEGGAGAKIEATYDPVAGELKLTGKETRAIYQTVITKIGFSSTVNGEATISEKRITIMVRDSIADSNEAARALEITEVFPEIAIVNAFTPNGDGVNEVWDIPNLDSYSDVAIFVYTSEGSRVYECRTTDCKWDGTHKGKALPAGTYMYTIDLNKGKREYKGTVTILK